MYYRNTQIHISCSFNTHNITSAQALEYSRLKVLMILFQRIQIIWSLIFLTYRHSVIFQKACLLSILGFASLTRVITKIPLPFTTANEYFHLTIVAAEWQRVLHF